MAALKEYTGPVIPNLTEYKGDVIPIEAGNAGRGSLNPPADAPAPPGEPDTSDQEQQVITSARPYRGRDNAGRGSTLGDVRRLDVPQPQTDSVFDRVRMDAPTADAEQNRQTMLRSSSPDSVMFTPGRALGDVNRNIEAYQQDQREQAAAQRGAANAQANDVSEQPVIDPNTGARIGSSVMPNVRNDTQRTPQDVAGDLTAAGLKIGPTALKSVAQMYAMGTGGLLGSETSKLMDEGQDAINTKFGSSASAKERQQLTDLLQDPKATTRDLAAFLASKPMLLSDMGIATVGSMFVPAGSVAALSKFSKIPLAAGTATTISNLANAGMNAADTFEQTKGDLGNKALAASVAGIGSYAVDKLTGGGAEGMLARNIAGVHNASPVREALASTFLKEPAQEYGENFSQQVGQDLGEGNAPDFGQANKQGVMGAMVAPLIAAPAGVHEVMGSGAEQQTPQQTALQIAKSKGFLFSPSPEETSRIQRLREAGEDNAANRLQASVDKRVATASAGAEVKALATSDKPWAVNPQFQTQYQQMRISGMKPADASAHAAMLTDFSIQASLEGLSPKAVDAAVTAASKLETDKVPGFLQKFSDAIATKTNQTPLTGLAERLQGVADDAMGTTADVLYSDTPKATTDAIAQLEAQQSQQEQQEQGPTSAETVQQAITNVAPGINPNNLPVINPDGIEGPAHEAATSPLNDRPEPTQAQKEAGNYKLGHDRIAGMEISIENPQGSTRRGTAPDGTPWETPMQHHYGYFKGTLAADGDKLDVFVKPGTPRDFNGNVYVVDQVDPKTGKFDEHKVVLGAADKTEAQAIYQSNYEPGWKGMGAITALPMPEFKSWAASGKLKDPLGKLPGSAPVDTGVLRIGITPKDAEPVTVRDGIVYVGKNEAVNFDSGEPIKIHNDATDQEIVTALRNAGALSRRQKVFGARAEEAVGKQSTTPKSGEEIKFSDWSDIGNGYQARQSTTHPTQQIKTPDGNIITRGLDTNGKEYTEFEGSGDPMKRGAMEWVDKAKNDLKTLALPKLSAPITADAVTTKPERQHIGRDGTPLDEGGKPFKTQREAKEFQKLQPHLRVVSHDKGFALIEKTAKQLEAEKAAARRIAAANAGGTGPQSAHEFIMAKGGMDQNTMQDLGFDKNPQFGNRYLFAGKGKNGLSLNQAAELLHEAGYIGSQTESEAAKIISTSAKGKPQYTPDGFDQVAQAQANSRFEDFLKTEQDAAQADDFDPFTSLEEIGYTVDDTTDTGYDEASDPLRLEINALLAEAEAKGIDIDTIKKQAYEDTRNGTDADYLQACRDALQKALATEQGGDGNRNPDSVQQSQARSEVAQPPAAPSTEGVSVSGFTLTDKPDGTLTIGGKPMWAIVDALEKAGITKYVPGRDTALVGKSQAKKAREALEQKTVLTAPTETDALKMSLGDFTANNAEKLTGMPSGTWVLLDGRRASYENPQFNVAFSWGNGKWSSGETSKTPGDAYQAALKTWTSRGNEAVNFKPADKSKFLSGMQGPDLLSAPTQADILAQQDRTDNAQALDDKAQIDREREGQTLTQPVAPEQRKENTGDIFGGPSAEEVLAARQAEDKAKAEKKAKEDAASGQTGMFGESTAQPEAPAPKQTKAAPAKIDDIGEKIGGARKDTAISTGAQRKAFKEENDKPTWAKRFSVAEIAGGANFTRNGINLTGKWVIRDLRKEDRLGQPQQVGGYFDTREAAEEALPLIAVAQKHSVVNTTTPEGQRYEIWRRINDRKIVKVVDREFKTREQAMEYMAKHPVEILETNTTFGESDLPKPENIGRIGIERRTGDVKGEDFKNTFGFRGVEFGLWNNQDERQEVMNAAYDGLMDLAEVLKVPPKAIGLNGDLALAFGARGKGLSGARAHYETDRVVMNLTKMNGAGALAHEWFHALDHYLARQDGKTTAEWKINKDGTRSLEVKGGEADMASSGFKTHNSGVRKELRAAYTSLVQSLFSKAEQYVEDTAKADKFVGVARGELEAALNKLRKDLAEQKDVTYYKRNNKPASAEQLAEFDTLAGELVEGRGLSTEWENVPGKNAASSRSRMAMNYRHTNETLEKLSELYKAVRGRSGFTTDKGGVLDSLTGYMRRYDQRLQMLREAAAATTKTKRVPTSFAMDAKSLDQGRGGDYWTSPHEMVARAFQGYVEDAIAAKDGKSPFLNYAPENAGILTPWGAKRPFPSGEERKAMNAEFEKFIDTLQTKEDEAGNVAMFSRRSDTPINLPPAIIGGNLGTATEHADYKAAKSGDVEAAVRVAKDLVTPDLVEKVREHIGKEKPIVLPVVSVEASGRNKVPRAAAEVLAKQLGLETADSVAQANSPKRTVMDGLDRIFATPEFDGQIEPGKKYLLVDDTLTQGATFAALASHIRENGGEVIGTVALTGKQYSATMQPTEGLLTRLHDRLGDIENDFKTATGYGFNALTQSEARYLANYEPVADLRTRILEEGRRARQGEDSGDASLSLKDSKDNAAPQSGVSTSGYNARQIQAAVNKLTLNWLKKPDIHVIDSMNDAPERVRDVWLGQNSQGAAGDIEGFHWKGGVYIVADAMRRPSDIIRVLFHESLGHFGMRNAFGDALLPILRDVAKARPADIMRKAKQYGLDHTTDAGRVQAAEEVLAEMAQTRPEIGFVKRAIAAIRTYLRNNVAMFKNLDLTDDEIIRSILMPARDFVEKGKRGDHANVNLFPAMSREDSNLPSSANGITVKEIGGKYAAVRNQGTGNEQHISYHDTQQAADEAAERARTEIRGQHHGRWWIAGNSQSIQSTGSGRLDSVGRAKVVQETLNARSDSVKTRSDAIGLEQIEDRAGYCYPLAAQASAAGLGDMVIGRATGPDGEAVWHAVVMRNGMTYDPTFGKWFKPGLYEELGFKPRLTLTTEQVRDFIAKTGRAPDAKNQGLNDDPMFSRSEPSEPKAWDVPESTKVDRVIYELQDGHVDLKRVQQAIAKTGKEIDEKFDARLAETLYPGRVARRHELFLQKEVQPLLESMARHNASMDELADYLLARHAPERNEQIAKINPELADGGAGSNSKGELMTTKAAQDYLANMDPKRREVMAMLARRVDSITDGTRKLIVAEGLEKPDVVAKWEGAYKNYVPLFKDEAAEGIPHPQGTGFSVRGGASKRATGSTKQVTNVLAHVLMQREAAITRAEKNRVGLALYGLALSNPNKNYWTTIRPGMAPKLIAKELEAMGVDPGPAMASMSGIPTIRTVDPVTQTVVDRPNPTYKSMPTAITLKVNGEDRVLMLNAKEPRAVRMAESLKNLDGLTRFDLAQGIIGRATRWLASVNTQYNPAFGFVNLVRDTLDGAVNLGSTPLRGQTLATMSKIPAAIKGIAKELAGNDTDEWAKLFKQFQLDGGKTGYKEMWRDPYERAKAVEDELQGYEKAGKLTPGRVAHAAMDLLDHFNTTLENATRLAAYKQALDHGMSRAESARLARELTVDFNRKGRAAREIGPLYAFFNASVQGVARTIEALKGPTGMKIVAGGLALGAIQALMLASAGYDDDEIPEWVKARALIIPLNWSGKGEKRHVMIPYPLGLQAIPNTGRTLTELTLNGGKDLGKHIFDALGNVASAISPLGGGNIFTAHGALNTFAPTLLDPLVDVGFNENFAGYKIEKDSPQGELDNRPGYQRTKENTLRTATGQAYLGISRAINALTGGTPYEAGLASPTPERVQYLAQVAGGGVLRELEKAINNSVKYVNNEKVKPSGIPLLGRFYGEVDDDAVQQSRYYTSTRKIDTLANSLKAARQAGDGEAMVHMIEDHPEAAMIRATDKVQSELAKLNKLAVTTVNDRETMQALDDARLARMKALNVAIKQMEDASGKVTLGQRLRGVTKPAELAEAH